MNFKTWEFLAMGFLFVVLGMILGADILLIMQLKDNLEPRYFSEPYNIYYVDLTSEQISMVKNATWDIIWAYSYMAKNIYFFNNTSSLRNKRIARSIREHDSLLGMNYDSGEEIYIYFNDDLCGLRETLCHELLHSMLGDRVSNEELFTYHLSHRYVCYENIFCEQNGTMVQVYNSIIKNETQDSL